MNQETGNEGRIPTLHVVADTIPQAHYRAMKAVWQHGLAIRTEYDRKDAKGAYIDPPSRDARVLIEVQNPFGEPRFPPLSFCEIGTYIAEIMGINLTYYRVLAFGVSSFYAGVGGALMAHYTGFVSAEAFDLLLSINFLAMAIIGGLGSVMGSIMGAAFILMLPEVMQSIVRFIQGLGIGQGAAFTEGLAYMKEMAIGLAIVLFLVFEPDGLAARWRKIKAYWKLYPFSY